jgi:hypothetical protein
VNAPSFFMKSAWLGGIEVTDGKIDLRSGAPGELRILVSTNTATIRGTAPAGLVVLVARAEGSRFEFGRGVGVGSNGQFTIGGLAPGKYRVVAGVHPDLFSGDSGQEVTLVEGQTLVMELKAGEVQ